MPSSSSSASPSSSSPQKAPQSASQSSGITELKPIGICLSSNSSLDMSTSSTTLATGRTTTSMTNANANYYHGTSAVSSSSSSSSGTAIPVGALSVMVARFASVDANTRQPTVILHPRAGSAITSNTRANVVVSGGSAIRASTIIGGPSLVSSSSTPISSSSASISVRTTHLIGQQPHQPLSVMNLSGVNSNASGVTQKHIQRPFIATANALPIESVSLVMANDTNAVVNARPIRLHATDGKQNATVHSINKITPGQRANVMTASTIVTTQPPKMISIGPSGTASGTTVPQHVARVGIIGQLPAGSSVTTGGTKPGIINLATATLPKGFIFNSSSNLNSGNTTVHNMVSVGGAVASFTTAQSQSGKVSVNVTNNSATQRQAIITSAPFGHHTSVNASQQSQHLRPVPQITTTTSNSLQSSQSALQSTTTCTTSPLRPTILSSPANSPIKQTMQTSTPSSPRPSILIRKRISNDTQSVNTSSTIFKASVSTSSPLTPLRGTIIAINSNDSSVSAVSANIDTRNNDIHPSHDHSVNIITPLTPNSEGNATPRKKPRKQLLEPFNMKSSQNIQLLNSGGEIKLKEEYCNNDRDEIVEMNNKRPRVRLLTAYSMQSKSLQYHFLRYSDVRPKPEKKLTLSELSNEGIQKKNGWKIHHLATQMELMSDNETNVNDRLTFFLQNFEKDASVSEPNSSSLSSQSIPLSSSISSSISLSQTLSDCKTHPNVNNNNILSGETFDANSIATKLNDLIRGNLQRSHLFSDQINEARQLVIKLTNDHKERVGKITKKCTNKRTFVTK